MNIYYVYFHRRQTDGTIFYVGKGSKKRAYEIKKRSDHWKNVVKKNGLLVEIYQENLSEEDAFILEKKMIKQIGFDFLVNLTFGGEGSAGRIITDELLLKIRNYTQSEENRQRVSKQWKGVKRGIDFCKKTSERQIGKKFNDNHIENLRKAKINSMKKVKCIEKNIIFESVFYAEQWLKSIGLATKSAQTQIRHVCKKRCKTACGFSWEYI